MAQDGPRAFETEATQLGEVLADGLAARPGLVASVQELEEIHNTVGEQLATMRRELDVLQGAVDIGDTLTRIESRAVGTGDVPLFVYARSMRQPFFETSGAQLEIEEKGRIGQLEVHQAALMAAHDYARVGDFLAASTEPVPFIRLADFSRNQFQERRWGKLALGWLEPGASIAIATPKIEAPQRFVGHQPESFTVPILAVSDVQVAGKVEHQQEDGMDYIDRWAYWPMEGAEINLMDGHVPKTVPKEAPKPLAVVPVNSIEASSSFLVGEECFRFLDTVRSSRKWRSGDDKTLFTDGVATMREVLSAPVTYEQAQQALVL